MKSAHITNDSIEYTDRQICICYVPYIYIMSKPFGIYNTQEMEGFFFKAKELLGIYTMSVNLRNNSFSTHCGVCHSDILCKELQFIFVLDIRCV
jgi:predicted ATPase